MFFLSVGYKRFLSQTALPDWLPIPVPVHNWQWFLKVLCFRFKQENFLWSPSGFKVTVLFPFLGKPFKGFLSLSMSLHALLEVCMIINDIFFLNKRCTRQTILATNTVFLCQIKGFGDVSNISSYGKLLWAGSYFAVPAVTIYGDQNLI